MVQVLLSTGAPTAGICSEAGPCGFTLARELEKAGIQCIVAGPSKIYRPVRTGNTTHRLNFFIKSLSCAPPAAGDKKTMTHMTPEFQLSTYNYTIDEKYIAQHPADKRDSSKLLVLDKKTGTLACTDFSCIGQYLPKDALLVANNSKVLPARIFGHKETGGQVEFLLLTPLPLIAAGSFQETSWKKAKVHCLLRASKAPKPETKITFSKNFYLTIQKTTGFGRYTATLCWQGELVEHFLALGHYPLPPYIRRENIDNDALRYQTVYAKNDKTGAVAAPTAGLHFTPALQKKLANQGLSWTEITLYVGYGTFSPVREKDIRKHQMHKEYIEISPHAAGAVAAAKACGRPVVAVGTTSVRALEGVFSKTNAITPYTGWTDIYLYPGKTFQVTDHMITNFHLPQSSLLIMVAAFAGLKHILAAYRLALKKNFRFFSYGDAMLIR